MTKRAITLSRIAICSLSGTGSMAKAKNRKVHQFSSSLHLHLKRAFGTKVEMEKFGGELEKYVKKVSSEIAVKGVRFVTPKTGGFVVASRKNRLTYGLLKNGVAVNIEGDASPNDLKALDQFLNRVLSFLEISKLSLHCVTGVISVTFQFSGDSIERFYNKPIIADFASKIRMETLPIGIALQIKFSDDRFMCMFTQSPEKENTSVIISQYVQRFKQPWDILCQSNNQILTAKNQILTVLGVKEQ